MRPTWLRSLSAVSFLVLVGAATSGAVAAPSPAAPVVASDPCTASSALAEPAWCAAARPESAIAPGAQDVAVTAGNAYADGLSTSGGGTFAKLTFPPADMSAPGIVDADAGSLSLFGYDFSPDGQTLYAVENAASTLNTVNLTTGALTLVGPMTKPVGDNWFDLTIDPVTGVAYAASVNAANYTLHSLDLTTGATTVINAAVATTATPIDMSMNCAGEMYATTIVDDSLYRVNPTTAALTLVGPIGVNLSFAQGIDFNNATGALHAWLYSGGGVHQYSTLNLATGAATAQGPSDPNGEFEGAISTTCPPPTAAVTSGPTGHTALARPVFGFTTTNARGVACSVDKGTPVFATCAGPTYQPAANLAPGDYTFRVRATQGAQSVLATRAFTVVDCATLKANVAKAQEKVKKAKKKLKKAKKTGSQQAITKAKTKVKKAKAKLKAARAALAAEPVCG